MKRTTLAASVAGPLCLGLCLASPSFAAQPSATGATRHDTSSANGNAAMAKPATQCLGDLSDFNSQMSKDGHWLGGSRYGYGYPLGGFGSARGAMRNNGSAASTGYMNARPGYEVRTLIAAASILARHGQQQPCENVLTTTRAIYKTYEADLRADKAAPSNMPNWKQRQITAAQPVTGNNTSFRSDELIGTEVSNPQNVALGSVEDLVTDPQTGKIAYLVIGRGGVFGIDEKYVPVPWQAFKATPQVNLLVLGTTKAIMDAAPQVDNHQFGVAGGFARQSKKVDAYWKTHLTNKGDMGGSGSNG
jgi:sporulation protein YlmC with PRC-barrel domain